MLPRVRDPAVPYAELVAEIAAEITTIRGTPGFVSPVLDDPYAAGLVHEVLRAAEEGNALAADTLLRVAVTRLLRLNGGPLPQRGVHTAGARVAARARAVLEERMAEPPTLERLAADLGTSPFALLRAFRETYGMPPHTWLTDARVRRARHLLDAGSAPARRPSPSASPTSPISIVTSPGSWACLRAPTSASARTYKTSTGGRTYRPGCGRTDNSRRHTQ